MRIFIYGVPGAGKTYYSKILGKKLNLPVLEADKIKGKVSPLKTLKTCLAYKRFGALTLKNAIKGLLLVRNTYQKVVEEKILKSRDFVMEGAFLDPNQLIKFGKLILLITSDENKHQIQFLKHREKLLDFQKNEFRAARMVQKYMMTEAKRLNVEIIENAS